MQNSKRCTRSGGSEVDSLTYWLVIFSVLAFMALLGLVAQAVAR